MMALQNCSMDGAGKDLWRPSGPTPCSTRADCSELCPDGFGVAPRMEAQLYS